MSSRALAIALVLAVIVGAAVYLTAARPAPRAAAAPSVLPALDPARVSRITLEDDRGTFAIERTPAGLWQTAPLAPGAAPWPIDPVRIRRALKALAEADAQTAQKAPPPADVATLSLALDSDAHWTLAIDLARLAGRARAWAGESPVTINAEVADLWTRPGPAAWRDIAALPGVGAETARITLRSASGEIRLARFRNAWRVTAPISARADDAAVQALLDALGKITVARFDAEPRAFTPWLGVTIESDAREAPPGAEPRVLTRTRSLAVGPPDASGQRLAPATPDQGASAILVNAESLADLPTDALAYASRSAAQTIPADVGMIVITPAADSADPRPERGFRRGIDGWQSLRDDGTLEPVDDAPINDILDLLSARISPDLRAGDLGGAFEPLFTVRLLGFADEPLEALELGRVTLVAGADLAIRTPGVAGANTPGVTRVYPGAELPSLLAP